jgi:hypothetical protein
VSVPVVVGTAVGTNGGIERTPLVVPAGTATGDLLLAFIQTTGGATELLDDASKGWWRLANQPFGTREFWVLARIYSANDPASTYTITQQGPGNGAWSTQSVRGHGVTSLSNLIVSPPWLRGTSIGSIVMPSVTTPTPEWLALAYTGEATNSVGTWTVTKDEGFTLLAQRVADGNIEEVTVFRKNLPNAGPSGAHEITYNVSAANGVGIQVAIPPGGGAVAPATGQIGARISSGPASDRLTIGVDKRGGSVIQAVLMNAAETTEVARATIATDATSGWGHTQFTGLTANTQYVVRFVIDGTVQTDAKMRVRTLPVSGTFRAIAGSCQFTGSNHPIWDRIREQQPLFLAHMGDMHYGDAGTAVDWRTAMEASLTAPKFAALLETTLLNWAPDNHDRIITNPTGAGTGLNLGETDPATNTEWRRLAGAQGWSSELTLGRTWVAGRVRFIQTDGWSVRDDGDGDPSPRTFLGASQKQWFKDVLNGATEPLIVWFTQWTARNNGNGRWDSFREESTELEAFINARPSLKRRMVLIGGDSHSLQADSGSSANTARLASNAYRFKGMPSLNMSGFNRSSDSGDGGAAGEWDIANQSLRAPGSLEADWGGYSRMAFEDKGQGGIDFTWEAVRVNAAGVEDVMATFEGEFGSKLGRFLYWDGAKETLLTAIEWNGFVDTVLEPVVKT